MGGPGDDPRTSTGVTLSIDLEKGVQPGTVRAEPQQCSRGNSPPHATFISFDTPLLSEVCCLGELLHSLGFVACWVLHPVQPPKFYPRIGPPLRPYGYSLYPWSGSQVPDIAGMWLSFHRSNTSRGAVRAG